MSTQKINKTQRKTERKKTWDEKVMTEKTINRKGIVRPFLRIIILN